MNSCFELNPIGPNLWHMRGLNNRYIRIRLCGCDVCECGTSMERSDGADVISRRSGVIADSIAVSDGDDRHEPNLEAHCNTIHTITRYTPPILRPVLPPPLHPQSLVFPRSSSTNYSLHQVASVVTVSVASIHGVVCTVLISDEGELARM